MSGFRGILIQEDQMLKTETNTRAMGDRVVSVARKVLKRRNLASFFEHGQWWVEHIPSGAQWSVVDAGNREQGPDGFGFEQVTEGEEE